MLQKLSTLPIYHLMTTINQHRDIQCFSIMSSGRVSDRCIVIFISLLSLLLSSGLLVLGLTLTLQSRNVSGHIGTKIYIIYGPALVDGIRNLLPNIPGKESL